MNFLAQKRKKILLQEDSPSSGREHPFNDFYYKEIALLTGAGGYRVDFINKTSYIDPQGQRILQIPSGFKPSLVKNLLNFYAEEEQERVSKTFAACSNGIPFTTTVKMVTYTGEPFWAKAIGKPMKDRAGRIIGVQGVFQDVSLEKNRELQLQSSVETIASQNSKLVDFAHLVSHSLKSHTNNLTMVLDLLKEAENKNEETELMDGLSSITSELHGTIQHLSEIVTFQDKANDGKQQVFFEEVLQEVTNKLHGSISEARAEIFNDFSEAPKVAYFPAYLASIFSNLITNAIRFKHPDRSPVIDIFTTEKDGEVTLIFKDNGRGFDASKHGTTIFNLYETLEDDSQSKGVGLFMVKSQIESLNGSISVKSAPDNGATFTIQL